MNKPMSLITESTSSAVHAVLNTVIITSIAAMAARRAAVDVMSVSLSLSD